MKSAGDPAVLDEICVGRLAQEPLVLADDADWPCRRRVDRPRVANDGLR
jgi:hypothetical protein